MNILANALSSYDEPMTVLDTEERAEQDKQGYLLKKLTLAFGETTQEKKKKKARYGKCSKGKRESHVRERD